MNSATSRRHHAPPPHPFAEPPPPSDSSRRCTPGDANFRPRDGPWKKLPWEVLGSSSRFSVSLPVRVALPMVFLAFPSSLSRILGYPKRRNEMKKNRTHRCCCFSSVATSSLFSPSLSSSSSSFLREFSLSLTFALLLSFKLGCKIANVRFLFSLFFLGTTRPRMASVFPAYNHFKSSTEQCHDCTVSAANPLPFTV